MSERCIIIAKSTKQQCKNYAKKGSKCCSVHQKQCLELEPQRRVSPPQPGPSTPPRRVSPPQPGPSSPQPGPSTPSRRVSPPRRVLQKNIIELLENSCSIDEFDIIKQNNEALYLTFLKYSINQTADISMEEMIERVKDKLKELRIKSKEINDNIDYLRYLYLYSKGDEIAINYCNLSSRCNICTEFGKEFIEFHTTKEGIVHKMCQGCFIKTSRIKDDKVECPFCRENVTVGLIERGIIKKDEPEEEMSDDDIPPNLKYNVYVKAYLEKARKRAQQKGRRFNPEQAFINAVKSWKRKGLRR